MFGKQLFMRFGEVQLLDETHPFALFTPKTRMPRPTKPSQTHRLDLLVVDSGLPASDTLPGGVKHG